MANMLNNAAVVSANTLLPVIALQNLDLPPSVFAAIGTVGALGGIAGAAVASTVTKRIGLRATRAAAAGILTLSVAVVIAAVVGMMPGSPILWLGVQSVLTAAATAIAMVAGSDLIPRLVSSQSLGTVMGAQRALVVGVMPIAALAVGALGAILGSVATMWVWFALAAASIVPSLALQDSRSS